MLPKLASLLGRKDLSGDRAQVECFASSRISRELGLEVLRATPERRNHLQGIRGRLSSMTLEEKDELVDRLFARLALFVYDLPASESSHHRERFGLFDHLLEVAHRTVREVSGPGFEVSPEHSTNHRERPLWAYAGLVGAIAHDIGKPLDLEVVAPGGGESWDPKKEPLRRFCERHELPGTGPELWHFHPGRGLRGHEKFTSTLLPLVLTPAVGEYLGPRLPSVIEAMTQDREWKGPAGRSHPAQEVVRIVRRMDMASSREEGVENRDRSAESVRPAPPEAPGSTRPPVAEQKALPFPPEKPRPVPMAVTPLEASPLFLPPDFRPEPVPDPRHRRGDPTEVELRLKAELDPARFLDTLRRMLVARRLSRNNLCTESYLRPDVVWLIVPRALRRVALINRLPWDRAAEADMLRSLRSSPQVAAGGSGRGTVFVKPRPEGATFEAIRIITRGFLSDAELGCLGIYPYELQALEPTQAAAVAG